MSCDVSSFVFCQSEHLDVNIKEFMSFTLTWELSFWLKTL